MRSNMRQRRSASGWPVASAWISLSCRLEAARLVGSVAHGGGLLRIGRGRVRLPRRPARLGPVRPRRCAAVCRLDPPPATATPRRRGPRQRGRRGMWVSQPPDRRSVDHPRACVSVMMGSHTDSHAGRAGSYRWQIGHAIGHCSRADRSSSSPSTESERVASGRSRSASPSRRDVPPLDVSNETGLTYSAAGCGGGGSLRLLVRAAVWSTVCPRRRERHG